VNAKVNFVSLEFFHHVNVKVNFVSMVYFYVISAIECGKTCKQKEGNPLKEYQQAILTYAMSYFKFIKS
jgi:hypothetical protein